MSFVSGLPIRATLKHWWRELDGDPARLAFIATKLLEVSAFYDAIRLGDAEPPPRARNRDVGSLEDHPRVAVVVPLLCRSARDERCIRRLVSRLREQSLPAEIIVVDDGSPHPAHLDVAHVLAQRFRRGPAAARNRGLDHALDLGVDVVAFTDADCVPERGWVAGLVEGLRDAHAVGGMTRAWDSGWWGRYHDLNGTLNGRRLDDGSLLYAPTCNFAARRELLEHVRFDETFPSAAAEDIDFCLRAIWSGWRVHLASDAHVEHDFGYTGSFPFRRFWRQFRRYAHGQRRLLRKHPYYWEVFATSSALPYVQSTNGRNGNARTGAVITPPSTASSLARERR
ncbi:MAG: glycosyltransferase [Deltaproteobacteria bacterium]|nr:glycosyltransferase [Deltaproteobacteria bacterium]